MEAACLGTVVEGKFVAEDAKAFKAAFYPHEGKRVRVKVERFRNRRSTQQNRYYWAVLVKMVAEAIGERDQETVHRMLSMEFNYEIVVFGNMEMRKPKPTPALDTQEFTEYMERVREWAAEFLSLYIPDPNEA